MSLKKNFSRNVHSPNNLFAKRSRESVKATIPFQVVKNNLNPVFNDEFSFVVGAKEQKINLNGKAFEN